MQELLAVFHARNLLAPLITEYQRTQAQLEVAWNELRNATPPETGLLLGTADGKLVIDGIPLEGHAERSFATPM